jgi:hypothetical protein
LGVERADLVLMEMLKVVQQRLEDLVVEVEGRSCGVVFVGERKGEAFLGHLSKRHSDVSNGPVHPSEAHLGHNFVVGYSMEVLKVFVGARYMKAWHSEDERMEETVVDSQTEEKKCGHMEKQYSAKRGAAAVVLDP